MSYSPETGFPGWFMGFTWDLWDEINKSLLQNDVFFWTIVSFWHGPFWKSDIPLRIQGFVPKESIKNRSNPTLKSDGIGFPEKSNPRLEWLYGFSAFIHFRVGMFFQSFFRMIWSKSVKVSKGLNVWADSGRSSWLDYPFLNGSFLPQGRVPGKWCIYLL